MHLVDTFKSILFLAIVFCNLACNANRITRSVNSEQLDTIRLDTLCEMEGNHILINKIIDLRGHLCPIPSGKILFFNGGSLKNGTVFGNNTKIEGNLNKIFCKVHIKGTWFVPTIKTSMFADAKQENLLTDVFALQNSSIHNRIIVERGTYQIRALQLWGVCLKLGSNTDLELRGSLQMMPNDFKGYNILLISGDNITVSGGGTIIGDKFTHTGSDGEWGMGIQISKANDVSIKNINIKNCWGDCIYINKSKNIVIDNCNLDNGRRQGISVISGNQISIKNCKISNISGTAPEYAIDVEPNKGDTVGNVLIENVTASRCKGGVFTEGRANRAYVRKVTIKNCNFSSMRGVSLSFYKTEQVELQNSIVKRSGIDCKINAQEVENLIIKNNTLTCNKDIDKRKILLITNCKKQAIVNNSFQ